MKASQYTCRDLLAVGGIIILILAVMLPALHMAKWNAYKNTCAKNLLGIGKAMLLYGADSQQPYPRAGGPGARWTPGKLRKWQGHTEAGLGEQVEQEIFAGKATITSCFYLLVKYVEVDPKRFICPGDKDAKLFEPSLYPEHPLDDITSAWDFGSRPGIHCSYSHHQPFIGQPHDQAHPVTPRSDPASPLCADRNPFLDKNAECYVWGRGKHKEPRWENGAFKDPSRTANSASHKRRGQNVLFNDCHVEFVTKPTVGIDEDNIWKRWPLDYDPNSSKEPSDKDRQIGGVTPEPCTKLGYAPASEKDVFLVNEYNGQCPQAPK